MPDRRAVAITGMSVMTGHDDGATGDGLDAFAAALRAGRSCVRIVPAEAFPGLPGPRAGAVIGDIDWDRRLDGLAPPRRATAARAGRGAGRVVRASLTAALAALPADEAAWPDAERLGIVVAGSNLMLGDSWRIAESFRAQPAWLSPRHGYRFYDTHIPALISEVVGARGQGMTVGGASASGNAALLAAHDLIAHGRADACLVVAPPPDLSPMEWHALDAMGATASPATAACRPFDRAADGFVPGEACAAIVLEAAEQARGPVRAILAGGCSVMGASQLPAPDAAGEARAMVGALRDGGIDVAALDYVNAHATATPGGDAAECRALREVLRGAGRAVPVNATKSITGHPLHAAGVVEAVACVLQMEGGFVHPTAGLDAPIADDLDLVRGEARRLPIGHALSNSFGFGAISTSILLRHPDLRA